MAQDNFAGSSFTWNSSRIQKLHQDVLPHAEALSHSEVVEERALLHLNREVDDGHVRVVERIENVCFAKVQLVKLKVKIIFTNNC